jgi:hypothetical protein
MLGLCPRESKRVCLAAGMLVLIGLFPEIRADEGSSASYVLEQAILDGSGNVSTSTQYVLSSTLTQAGTVQLSASPSFVLQSGFWSFESLESFVHVPVVLQVQRNGLDAGHCDLSWSGNAPPYDVYVSVDCAAVGDSFYATTSANSLLNVVPPHARLVCFDIQESRPAD